MDIKQLVHEAALYMHDNYSEQISVADISAEAYLSPSYFATVFRVLTGFTVGNYLNRYRLHCAATELAASDKRIIEIAFESGFLTQQSFTKSFSKAYGIAPAKFRLLKPSFKPFPPNNLWKWKEQQSMEIMECFKKKNVEFIRKDAFFVAGLEVDINYNEKSGTSPIGGAWELWEKENLSEIIPDRIGECTYGMTHSETIDGTAKYMVCVEVSTLDNLPVGLVGRRFAASDYAVFKTIMNKLGAFWRAFHTKWLPESGYALHEAQLRAEDYPAKKNWPSFNKYPDIEVYDINIEYSWESEESVLHIYAPVSKKT
jgi:AraC family transcriptional regulator